MNCLGPIVLEVSVSVHEQTSPVTFDLKKYSVHNSTTHSLRQSLLDDVNIDHHVTLTMALNYLVRGGIVFHECLVSWTSCVCVFFIDFVWSLQVTTLKNKLHVYVFYQIICSAVVIHQSECRFSLFSEKEKRQTEQRSDVGVWQMCNGWRKLIQCWHIWTH